MPVNPASYADIFHKQGRIAKLHRDYIIYSLRVLKHATSGEIHKFVMAKVEKDLEAKYRSAKNLSWDQQKVDKEKAAELRDNSISHRAVQKWLVRLKAEHLVSNNKYNVYSLTQMGHHVKIYGESYGKLLFDSLTSAPVIGSDDEKLANCIKVIGVMMVYIFLQVKGPTFQVNDSKRWYSLHRDILQMNDSAE